MRFSLLFGLLAAPFLARAGDGVRPAGDAQFAGAFTAGQPEVITGNTVIATLTTSEGTFTNLLGATASAVLTPNTLSSIGTPPASANDAVSGLSVHDGVNNLTSGNFQFDHGFDSHTRFFILESTPQSSTLGDAVTVTLLDAAHNAVGTYTLTLAATQFTASAANTTTSALAAVTYTTFQGTAAQKLGAVTFTLADFAGSGNASLATGLRLSSGTLDPNVVGIYSTSGSFPPAATPPDDAPGLNVLFVGNSYTHGSFEPLLSYHSAAITDANGTGYGGVPGIFKRLTESAGLNYHVTIEAISSQTLAYHLANRSNIIFQSHWHQVFLQEHSTGALPTEHGGNPNDFQAAAMALEQGIHAVQPHAQVFLYETFPRSDLTYVSGQTYYGEPIETMAQDLHDGYFGVPALDPNFHAVSPAGDAWLRAIQKDVADRNPYDGIDPGRVNLWAGDNHHASAAGCFLNALVHLGVATGLDPRSLGYEQTAVDLGLASNTAVSLEQMAYETLTNTALRPMVTLSGSNPLTVVKSAAYSDPGATAHDVAEGALIPVITAQTVVPDQVGSYLVSWEAVTSSGRTGWATRVVTVVDTNRPDLVVLGPDGTRIASGDLTPSEIDGTDFGAHDLIGPDLARTFTITNADAGTLSLTGAPAVEITGVHATDFAVTAPPATLMTSGAVSTFTVRFQPTATGTRQATISIASNDPDENPYTFTLQGTGTFNPAAFTHRLPIRLCGYARDEGLTNFPVLLDLSPAITNFDYATFLDPAGGDLRFTDDTQTRLLNHDLEAWNTNGHSLVWVQVPILVGSTTTLWAWWGQAGATNTPRYATNGATWSEHFAAVWHLAETSGPSRDASGHGLTGYPSNDVIQAADGQIGDGDDFGGVASRTFIGSPAALNNLTNNFTISAWIRPDVLGGNRVIFGSSWEAYHGWSLRLTGPNPALERLPGGTLSPGIAVTAGQWAAVAVTYDTANIATFYLNGNPVGRVTGTTAAAVATDPWSIGANSGDRFNGLLDEIEVSARVRSSNWIWAAYQATHAHRSLVCFGAVQASDAVVDTDGDGLPDAWEQQYGLDAQVANAPGAGSDGDWMTDREEYIADTSPISSNSVFAPVALSNAPAGLVNLIINPTSTNRVYGVFWTTNLLQQPQPWTMLPPESTGTGTALSFLITNDTPSRIYRTAVRLP